MSLGMTYSPTVPGGGAASCKLRPVFTYNNGYWKCFVCLVLGVRLRGGGYEGGSFLGELYHGGTEIQ